MAGTATSIPSGSQVTVTAKCGVASVLVGGGYQTGGDTTGDQFVHVFDNYPSTVGLAGVWTVRVGAQVTGVTVTPYALCSP
ncbi:MAG TPA: hypothetical protein VGF93_06230 [Solirubrobacteraceae bacterium]